MKRRRASEPLRPVFERARRDGSVEDRDPFPRKSLRGRLSGFLKRGKHGRVENPLINGE